MTIPSRAVTPHQKESQPSSASPYPQPAVIRHVPLRSHGANTTCESCQRKIHTRTEKKSSLWAWFSCVVLCFVGCFCGCCLIPHCMDTCKDTHHSCPDCGADLGTHRAF